MIYPYGSWFSQKQGRSCRCHTRTPARRQPMSGGGQQEQAQAWETQGLLLVVIIVDGMFWTNNKPPLYL